MTKKNLSLIIVKNVPTDFTESEILLNIKSDFPSCEQVDRFKTSPVIKISFSSSTEKDSATTNGLYIMGQFFKPQPFIQIKRPVRCFKCQRFGHILSNCRGDPACVKCKGNHSMTDCPDDTSCSCVNCGGDHMSSDPKCPVFLQLVEKLNQK